MIKEITITLSGLSIFSYLIGKPTIDFTTLSAKELYIYEKIGHTLTDFKGGFEIYVKTTTKEENDKLISIVNPSYLTEEQKKNSYVLFSSIITKTDDGFAITKRKKLSEEENLKVDRLTKDSLITIDNTSINDRMTNLKITEKIVKYLTVPETAMLIRAMYLPIYYPKKLNLEPKQKTDEKPSYDPPEKEIIRFEGQSNVQKAIKNFLIVTNQNEEYKCKVVKTFLGYNPGLTNFPPPQYRYMLYNPMDIAEFCMKRKEILKNVSQPEYIDDQRCFIFYKDLKEIKNGEIYLKTHEDIKSSDPNEITRILPTLKEMAKNCDEETKELAKMPNIYFQASLKPINMIKSNK